VLQAESNTSLLFNFNFNISLAVKKPLSSRDICRGVVKAKPVNSLLPLSVNEIL
jgi:hypothetical protein